MFSTGQLWASFGGIDRKISGFPQEGLRETAGLTACGETGIAGPGSEPLDRGALGRDHNSVRANRPD